MRRKSQYHLIALIIVVLMSSITAPIYAEDRSTTPATASVSASDWLMLTTVPTPQDVRKMKIPYEIKGVYMTGWTTGGGKKFNSILELLENSELNAVVIDVKEDKGDITYRSNIPLVNEIKSNHTRYISDIDAVLELLKEKNIYTIARVVAFKDPYMAGAKQEWSLQRKDGGVWKDRKGVMWVDPYRKEQWDYNLSVAVEVAQKGFDEIQLDYVRFPENGKKVDAEVEYYQANGVSKAEKIRDFVRYVRIGLEPYQVFLAADVFGLVPSVSDDMGIGQQWELLSPEVDYIAPMMYPSHYAKYTYGIPLPDKDPYGIIRGGLLDAKKKDQKLQEQGIKTAIIRPWYQDFTASYLPAGEWIPYTGKEVLDQYRAGEELGVREFMLWDPNNNFSRDAWVK